MKFEELMDSVRGKVGRCKACRVCDGVACGNSIPGPGCKAPGNIANRNFRKWARFLINMDTVGENFTPDTSFEMFGRKYSLPVFIAPIGAIKLHYSDYVTETDYNKIIASQSAENGSIAFIGDNDHYDVFENMLEGAVSSGAMVIPTIKPWKFEDIKRRMDDAAKLGAFAYCMDIDSIGLPIIKNTGAGPKTVAELKEIIEYANKPFILKGIMTAKAAEKAVEAGVSAIVVSNHGGRVQGGMPATAEVLEEIVDAVDGRCLVFVDGGLRNGVDIFKALAAGADAVLVGRPFVPAIFADRENGVKILLDKLRTELADTMLMCGAKTLKDINRSMYRIDPLV